MRGWKALAVLLTLITVCNAAFAWAVAVLVLIAITWSGLVSGEMPLSPAVMTLWPGAMTVWPWMLIGGLPAAFIFQFFVHWSSMWTDKLPEMSDAPNAASLTGVTIGLLVATCSSPSPMGWVLGGCATLIFAFLAIRMLRRTAVEIREQREYIGRMEDLHLRGSRVRADVEHVHFLNTWEGEAPLFEVTAGYDTPSGRRNTTGRLVTSGAGAPVVGGTVLLWFLGDGSDTENVDMDDDPMSIRDPDAAEKYEAPPS